MRSALHAYSTEIEASAALPSPHRRVMQAALTIHRAIEGALLDAFQAEQAHKKAHMSAAGLCARSGETTRIADIHTATKELISNFASYNHQLLDNSSRIILENIIERLISILDQIDGDADHEPCLGIPEISCIYQVGSPLGCTNDAEEGDDNGIADYGGLSDAYGNVTFQGSRAHPGRESH